MIDAFTNWTHISQSQQIFQYNSHANPCVYSTLCAS